MSPMAVHLPVSKGPAGQTQPREAFSDELHLSSLGHQTDHTQNQGILILLGVFKRTKGLE